MLNTDAGNLWREYKHAESVRDAQLRHLQRAVSTYHGTYSHTGEQADLWPENIFYEFITNIMPQVIHDNPRVQWSARRAAPKKIIQAIDQRIVMAAQAAETGMSDPLALEPIVNKLNEMRERLKAPAEVAEALTYVTNDWVDSSDARFHLDDIAYDYLFAHGAMMTVQKAVPGLGRPGAPEEVLASDESDTPYAPVWQRISPYRFFMDPMALWYGGVRFSGHDAYADIDDLLERPDEEGWNKEALRDAKPTVKPQDKARKSGVSGGDNDHPQRNEIRYAEIWVPESQADGFSTSDGFHGTVYTIATDGEPDDYLRDPYPYYGPPWGPYTMYGCYRVPDSPWPLGPIMATFGQAEHLNDIARAMKKGSENYKRVVMTGSKDLQKKSVASKHDYVVYVPGLTKDETIEVEQGGVTEQQNHHFSMAMERMRRSVGLTETQSGNVTSGREFATTEAIAAEAARNRTVLIRNRFADATEQALKTIGWFFYHDDRVRQHLSTEVAEELGGVGPIYVGGKSDIPFGQLDLKLDVHSMPRTNDQEQRQVSAELVEVVTQIATAMQTAPYVRWDEVLDKYGESRNEPDLSTLIDMDQFRETMMQQQQQQMMEQQGVQGEDTGEGSEGGGVAGNGEGSQALRLARL